LQALWLVLVLIDLATLIVSLPGYYHSLFTLCPGPVTSCPDTSQLNVHTLPTLLHAGFSLNTYALYVIFLDALTTLAFLLIGALIIWRRSNGTMTFSQILNQLLPGQHCCQQKSAPDRSGSLNLNSAEQVIHQENTTGHFQQSFCSFFREGLRL
jgi:hypothetical protein